ncbi:MAG: GNAT family N-acetyltransferase [Actinomycetota bacterium]|nr:GNAT family N-acetyltransferase [Actinomycetota bacterium]
MRVTELQHDAEFAEAFGVIRELYHDLDGRRYRELIPEMRTTGYRMFAVREEGNIVGVAGGQRLTNLYYGRHLYVYDLSVTAGARSKGHSEGLLRHVEGVARGEGRGYVALACGRERDAALRFYEERIGYEWPGYSMRKALTA